MEQVKTVMKEEFVKEYDFYKDYDDMVIHKETEQIFLVLALSLKKLTS